MEVRDFHLHSDLGRTEHREVQQTRWWIITGGLSTGKTTLLDELRANGYMTMTEAARDVIDEGIAAGETIAQIRSDEIGFQLYVHERKKRREEIIPADELTFWDRGFLGDSIAYLSAVLLEDKRSAQSLNDGDIYGTDLMVEVERRRYAGIFLLDRIPYRGDYARTESEQEADRIHTIIENIYKLLGYEPIKVPVLPTDERAQFITNHVRSVDRDFIEPERRQYKLPTL